MDGYYGMIMLWAANYCPRNWMYCQGQTLRINEYQALFALIGTTYGGDGVSTFKLPDLRGRVAVGSGPNQEKAYFRGDKGGVTANTIKITQNNLPNLDFNVGDIQITIPQLSFNLDISVNSDNGDISTPVDGNYFAVPNNAGRAIPSFSNDLTQEKLKKINGGQVDIPSHNVETSLQGTIPGGNQQISFSNEQPYFTLDYIICVDGMWPERP